MTLRYSWTLLDLAVLALVKVEPVPSPLQGGQGERRDAAMVAAAARWRGTRSVGAGPCGSSSVSTQSQAGPPAPQKPPQKSPASASPVETVPPPLPPPPTQHTHINCSTYTCAAYVCRLLSCSYWLLSALLLVEACSAFASSDAAARSSYSQCPAILKADILLKSRKSVETLKILRSWSRPASILLTWPYHQAS